MKGRVGITLLISLVLAGAWGYRSIFPPVDPLTADTLALAEHFRDSGIPVRPYAVRNGFSHSIVVAAAALEIEGFPLPVSVDVCPNAAVAANHLLAIEESPNLTHPMRNGRIIIYLPMWGDDTGVMAKRVELAFASFSHPG
jgi:hypothetical protein